LPLFFSSPPPSPGKGTNRSADNDISFPFLFFLLREEEEVNAARSFSFPSIQVSFLQIMRKDIPPFSSFFSFLFSAPPPNGSQDILRGGAILFSFFFRPQLILFIDVIPTPFFSFFFSLLGDHFTVHAGPAETLFFPS